MSPSTPTIDNLPPFGLNNEDNEVFLRARPVPERFTAPNSATTGTKSSADAWDAWIHERALEMADFLWPAYNNNTRTWEGKARDKALALTEVDLTLVLKLQSKMQERVTGKVDGVVRKTVKHLDLFRPEDEPTPPRLTFAAYDDKFLTPLNSCEWERAVIMGGRSIARPASQALKKKLQRPRPMQTAMMLGINGLVVHRSVTAVSPAMIGGHCIQGMMALAELEESMADAFASAPDVKKDVQRFFIDTGDRRIYAGLHHPSDNMGSWWIGFKLCDRVFAANDAPRIRKKLWDAITTYSEVYQEMVSHANSHNSSPYAALLAELEQVALSSSTNKY